MELRKISELSSILLSDVVAISLNSAVRRQRISVQIGSVEFSLPAADPLRATPSEEGRVGGRGREGGRLNCDI